MRRSSNQPGGTGLSALMDGALREEHLSSGSFRAILDALPTAVYTTDVEGRLNYFNPACVELAGRTPRLGADRWCVTWKLYHPDGTSMPHAECPMAVALKEGRIVRGAEAVAERPDGTRTWFMPHPTPLRDADGRVIGGINMLVDITERKRQEEALRRSERKLQRVLETEAVAVLFFDYQGTLVGANDVFLGMTGYRREQIESRELTWRTMTPPEWVEASERQMRQFARTGRIGPYEKEYFLADGTRRWMMFAGRDLGDGTIAEFCVDITDGKRREADSHALAALGSQVITADEPREIYEKMVEAAAGLMRSDFASMQRFHPGRGAAGELELLAHRGFDPEGVKFWQWVSAGSTCVCGLTLRAGARVVIPDAALCDRLDEGQRKAYGDAGIRAMQSTPLFSRGGKLLGMISTHWRHPHQPTEGELRNFDILARQAADVIERSHAEDALRESEQQLSGMFAQAGVGVVMMRADDCTLLRVNPTFCQIVGYPEEELVGMSCLDLTHPDDLPRTRRRLEQLLASGQRTGTIEKRYVRKDGRPVWVRVNLAGLADRDGRRAVAMVEDVTEQRVATESLARAKEEAEAANIAKDNLLATLSHELRTPLTPVLATLSSWETNPAFPGTLAEDLAMVRRNVDLEARLIDDLLDLTRIAKGKVALHLEVLDVHKVLDAVVAMYLSEIRGKRINLAVRPAAGECHVRADPGRLQQAFWNVLKNAAKFTPEGGSIDIATRNEGQGHVQVVVTDTGVGMSREMLGRLFQPFEQETAGRYGGLGLGLAITKTLLEAQGGAIEARSDGPGKGASFVITLPCVSRPLAAAPASPAPRESERPSPDGAYRVLLVEDHADTARALARLLGRNGHTVTTAHCVADALAALRGQEFDVLLSDIGLPDGTGIDLIAAVRNDLRSSVPAVALTGFGMEDDVRRTLQAGFNDHLTKPVNFARLEQAIQRACNGQGGSGAAE